MAAVNIDECIFLSVLWGIQVSAIAGGRVVNKWEKSKSSPPSRSSPCISMKRTTNVVFSKPESCYYFGRTY